MAKRPCGKRADNLKRPFWPLELSQSKGKIVCPWSQPPIFGLPSNFPLKVKSWEWKGQFMDYASVVSSAPEKRKSKIVFSPV